MFYFVIFILVCHNILVKPRAFIALSDDDKGEPVNSVKYYLALQMQDIPAVVIYKALSIVVVNFLCHTRTKVPGISV